MYKSTILPRAKEDIRDAARWYNKQSLGLGKRFTDEVRDSVQFIKQNPIASNIRYDEVRTAVLCFIYRIPMYGDNLIIYLSAAIKLPFSTLVQPVPFFAGSRSAPARFSAGYMPQQLVRHTV